MARRTTWSALLALVTMLALAAPAQAGGWAIVSLDALPSDLRAGQSVSLGFMVRQHGITPNNSVQPRFTATNTATSDSIQFDGRREGGDGHYIVDVTFPSAGAWDVEIVPEPFGGTTLGTFTVQPAASTTSTVGAWAVQPMLRVIGGTLVLAALGLGLASRRAKNQRAHRRLALGEAYDGTNEWI